MKTIAQHIEQLFTRNECIIVPNLGGFVVYEEGAKVEKNTLQSPSKKIRFNSLLSYHDGLLAEAVMKERAMDYSSALAVIQHEVATIKQEIEKGNCVSFGKIGMFTPSNNSAVTMNFQQTNYNFLPDNLGLPLVQLNKIKRENIPSSAATTNKNIVIQLPTNGTKVFKYAASIAIIFLLTLFSPKTNDTAYTAKLAFNSISFASSDKNSNDNTLNQLKTDDITIDMPIEAEIPSQIETTKSKNLQYHIIIASFPNEAAAVRHIEENGNKSLQIIEKDNKFRISENGFNTYDEAFEYFSRVKSEKSCWILKL